MRTVTNEERRSRLGIRHALAPGHAAGTPEDVARSLVALHATELASVHLATRARMPDFRVADMDRALYTDRTLMSQLAMRETLFVFPRELVPAAWGSISARFATSARKRHVKELERYASGPEADPAWLDEAEKIVLAHLADGRHRSLSTLRDEVPEISGTVLVSPEKSWGGRVALAPRMFRHLSLSAAVTRAENDGPWHLNKPLWTTPEHWWRGTPPAAPASREGYAELVHQWLWSFGPGTVEDIVWWLGATKTIVRTALAECAAVEVTLEDGRPAWLRADDTDPVAPPEPWVALLPVLDPTIMGWKERDFYLGDHRPRLFDSVGNAGTSVWVDGRVVGAWAQDPGGEVHVHLLEEMSDRETEAIAAEAARLTSWLDGTRAHTIYTSTAMKAAVAD